jgi:hypothetical protein
MFSDMFGSAKAAGGGDDQVGDGKDGGDNRNRNNLSLGLAIMLSTNPFGPSFGAGAVSIDYGGNFVGVEGDVGIVLMLSGKDFGYFSTYTETATGGGNGLSTGIEVTRFDFTGGNENITLEMMSGVRHKAYVSVDAIGVFSVGGALSLSGSIDGSRIIGTTVSLGFGISPLLDCGYNFGNINFDY